MNNQPVTDVLSGSLLVKILLIEYNEFSENKTVCIYCFKNKYKLLCFMVQQDYFV